MAADGGGVEAGIDAGEEDDEVFGDEIRDALVVRGEELGFGGFPRSGQCPIHRAAPLMSILYKNYCVKERSCGFELRR